MQVAAGGGVCSLEMGACVPALVAALTLFGAGAVAGRPASTGNPPAPERDAPPDDAPPDDAPPEQNSAGAPAKAPRGIRLVWEAGAEPLGPGEFLDAVLLRLPPGTFAPVGAGEEDAWIVLVRQPSPSVYQVEVAPPGRAAQARRLAFSDPVDGKRRLALLAAYALEHGEFPPVAAGSDVEEVAATLSARARATPAPAPSTPVASKPEPPSKPPADRPAEIPAARPPMDLRLVFGAHASGLLAAPPTSGAARRPGVGGALDLGLRLAKLAWVGAHADVSAHPGPDVQMTRVAAGAFVGVRPQWGWVHLGARLGADGGLVVGAARGESARRPFAAGEGGLELGVTFPGRTGLGLAVGVALRVASRASTFETPDTRTGLGRVRGRAWFGLTWVSRALLGRRRE